MRFTGAALDRARQKIREPDGLDAAAAVLAGHGIDPDDLAELLTSPTLLAALYAEGRYGVAFDERDYGVRR